MDIKFLNFFSTFRILPRDRERESIAEGRMVEKRLTVWPNEKEGNLNARPSMSFNL